MLIHPSSCDDRSRLRQHDPRMALPRSDEVTEAASGDPSVVDGFVGASEAGFIFSRSHSAVCTAGDAKVMLHLSGKGGVGDA
jgi:hypothetical protein